MNENIYISSAVRHADRHSSGYTFFSQIAQGSYASSLYIALRVGGILGYYMT